MSHATCSNHSVSASNPDLDAIVHELNHRPRKIHGYLTPAEVYADLLTAVMR